MPSLVSGEIYDTFVREVLPEIRLPNRLVGRNRPVALPPRSLRLHDVIKLRNASGGRGGSRRKDRRAARMTA